jgi:hypothetical protein
MVVDARSAPPGIAFNLESNVNHGFLIDQGLKEDSRVDGSSDDFWEQVCNLGVLDANCIWPLKAESPTVNIGLDLVSLFLKSALCLIALWIKFTC